MENPAIYVAERQSIVSQLSEQEIWHSDLAEEEKEQLAGAWAETIDVERRRELTGHRNETVRDYYEILYERTREDENNFER